MKEHDDLITELIARDPERADALASLATYIHKLEDACEEVEQAREIARVFFPVMDAMRPLVLNLERLRDMR